MAQHIVMDAVEADAVVDLGKKQLSAVDDCSIHIVNYTLRFFKLTPSQVIKVDRLLAAISHQPFLSLHIQSANIFLALSCAEILYFDKLTMPFAYHHDTRRA
jgi:hypothetical protein